MRKNSYVDLFIPNHHRARSSGNVHEHIVVAESMLGRRLSEQEVVHHEDGVRYNNNSENLYVFKNSSNHARYHRTGIKVKEGDYWVSPPQYGSKENPYIRNCEMCGSTYSTIEKITRFCSAKCRSLSDRVVERPSSEQLYELLSVNSFVKVGEMYGVSDNAVRKWCKNYNIPHKSMYYRRKSRHT